MSDLPTVLPPNAQQVELDLEQMSGRLLGFGDPIAALWDASACPEHLLPYLAWGFSVEVWDSAWPEAYKRQVLVNAVQVHRAKGTVGSVRRALSGIGFRTDISEWFEYGGDPHTFLLDAFGEDVFAAGMAIDARTLALVTSILVNLKPLRSHFELRIGERFDTDVYARAGARGRAVSELQHDPDPRTRIAEEPVSIRAASRSRLVSSVFHDVQTRDAA
ncbi:phage tail protein I [uncultured Sulfitobacter sp.]|uniref:phage tail protein I n=1 Tax=uncultured Sulfitobacter sp. TaxID=191468 RepID=UPI0030FA23A5